MAEGILEETTKRVATRLRDLRAATPQVQAAVLATRSGLPLAWDVEEAADAEALAALGADLLASAETAARGLTGGEPREATVRGPDAHVIALAAGGDAVLVATTDALTPASSVLPDLREAAEELAEVLG
ncbi:MAG: roadblock/LC7 domain-containing protein [Armatimonadota bacterium]|nr:roadblock/LC7 domain-containing protein [Armatimonadota bacterium]